MSNTNTNTNTNAKTSIMIGGVYTDPNHFSTKAGANLYKLQDPWFGGLRLLGRTDPSSKEFTCIGCDDGIHWYTLQGSFTDTDTSSSAEPAKVTMDFTPKAPGVGQLQCGFQAAEGALHFYEGDFGSAIENTWSRLVATPDFSVETQMMHAAFNDVNGFYVDPDIYKAGSFAGIRVVSDRLGKYLRDEICVVGTDNGSDWWAVTGGTFVNRRRGKVRISGDNDNEAKISSGTLQLTWDGKDVKWVKMAPKMDMHSLPKQQSSL